MFNIFARIKQFYPFKTKQKLKKIRIYQMPLNSSKITIVQNCTMSIKGYYYYYSEKNSGFYDY